MNQLNSVFGVILVAGFFSLLIIGSAAAAELVSTQQISTP
jgi:hypothetical protein